MLTFLFLFSPRLSPSFVGSAPKRGAEAQKILSDPFIFPTQKSSVRMAFSEPCGRIWTYVWRRGGDSNSRSGISRHTISNRAPSTSSDTSPNISLAVKTYKIIPSSKKSQENFSGRGSAIFLPHPGKTASVRCGQNGRIPRAPQRPPP